MYDHIYKYTDVDDDCVLCGQMKKAIFGIENIIRGDILI